MSQRRVAAAPSPPTQVEPPPLHFPGERPLSEPVIFVIERGPGGAEYPAVYRDHLPNWLTDKSSVGLMVYALRLDRLPDAEKWIAMSLDELATTYCFLRDRGKLPPPNLADPPRKTDPTRALVGHRETVGIGWLKERRAPDDYPVPGTLRLRPEEGGFIGPEQSAEVLPP